MSRVMKTLVAILTLGAAVTLNATALAQDTKPKIDPPRSPTKEIAEVEQQIIAAETAHEVATECLVLAQRQVEICKQVLRVACGSPTDLIAAQETLRQFQKNADEAAVKLKVLKARLAALKSV